MASMNINRSLTDPFYRYKMPPLSTKVEGKGNGIKTVIVNMVDVAKALDRPPTYTTKFLSCELGAQTQCDAKNDRYVVNGSHEAKTLQDVLDGFIRKFVLCPKCDLPETDLQVCPKKRTIGSLCRGCGHWCMVDTSHKVCTFILKNPPKKTADSESASDQKDKKRNRKKGKKDEAESHSDIAPLVEAKSHSDIAPLAEAKSYSDIAPLAEAKSHSDIAPLVEAKSHSDIAPLAEAKSHGDIATLAGDASIGDGDGETTEETQRRREEIEEMSDHLKSFILTEDVEKPLQERVNLFYNFVKQKKDDGTIDATHNSILAEAKRLEVKAMGPLILSELLFDEDIRHQIKTYKSLFGQFCDGEKAQKYLLRGFECLVKLHQAKLLPQVPRILHDLYEADLLQEDLIIAWAEKLSTKYVSKDLAKEMRAKAAPFIKWLKEAEEESDEGEDEGDGEDDDNFEVVFSPSARELTVETVKADKAEDEEEDIDIDAI